MGLEVSNATFLQPQGLFHWLHLKPRATRWSPSSTLKKKQNTKVLEVLEIEPLSVSVSDPASSRVISPSPALSFPACISLCPLIFASLGLLLFPAYRFPHSQKQEKIPKVIFLVNQKPFPLYPHPFILLWVPHTKILVFGLLPSGTVKNAFTNSYTGWRGWRTELSMDHKSTLNESIQKGSALAGPLLEDKWYMMLLQSALKQLIFINMLESH